jgi:dTMP kinase
VTADSPTSPGRFITIEGIDWCGKTTQALRLVQWLRGEGHRVLGTREPGGTPAGQAIRELLLDSASLSVWCELMLFLADRAQHLEEVIRPALAEGMIVVCERYTDSTLAYQGPGRGLDLDLLRRTNAAVTGGLVPDLTVLLDIAPELAAERRFHPDRGRAADRMEREADDFRRRVARGYLDLARAEPQRFRVIEAGGSAEAVAALVRREVSAFLAAEPAGSSGSRREGGSP